ncbi:MAG TPA: 50S ribosomal protein L29 [Limnochordales bacterium]
MKARELRDLSREDLLRKVDELKTELFNLRFQKAVGQLGNPMRIRQVRKDIARVLTVLRERELGIERAARTEDRAAAGEARTQG